ncbi:type 1 fimbrial protein [Enterobacteriaceae bacterium]
MNNAKYYASILLMGCAFYTGLSKAADTTMSFTATVVASPCELNIEKSETSIPLGDYYITDMHKDSSGTSARSPEHFFNLAFSNCPAGTKSVTATFNGVDNPDYSDSQSFKNDGTAENVGVQVKLKRDPWESGSFKNGSSVTATVAADQTAVFNFTASMYSPHSNATPGSVHSAVTVTFSYQ